MMLCIEMPVITPLYFRSSFVSLAHEVMDSFDKYTRNVFCARPWHMHLGLSKP